MAGAWTRATNWIDREWCMRLSDYVAVAMAAALPWSTSIFTILSVLWLIVVVPILNPAQLRRIVAMPAGGLPVLLVVLLLAGMLWAVGVPMAERLDGLKSALKLLYIPLLMIHFQRSERGAWVMIGFVASCVALLVPSLLDLAAPGAASALMTMKGAGVPARDYVAQSGEFTICIFLLAVVTLQAWREQRIAVAAALALLCAVFLFDMFGIVTSRTALAILPVLALLFAGRYFSRKGTIGVIVAAVVLGALALALAPQVRGTVSDLFSEVRDYKPDAIGTRASSSGSSRSASSPARL
jgi:O-antigen ligase